MISHDRAELLRNITVVMDVVQGWVTLMREKDGAQALSFFVSEL